MNRFADIPIKRKLTWITMLVSLSAIIVVCVALGIYEHVSFKRKLVRDISILTEIIADQSMASLDFDDDLTAAKVLKSLAAHDHVESASILTPEGELFAWYRRDGGQEPPSPPAESRIGHRFEARRLWYGSTIGDAGNPLGSLFIACDLEELDTRNASYLLMVAGAFLTAMVIALLLSGFLQHAVTRPILHLAETARSVARERNYSLRASKSGEDELGGLIDRFNEMLAEIQKRDEALRQAHDKLEQRVEERTAELNGANQHMKRLLKKYQDTQAELEAATKQALAASEAKSNFLASMSHEIRTPINGLLGFAKLLLDMPLSRTQREYVEIINTSGQALLSVINDILDFSKLEAGKLAVSIEPFELRKVVCDVADLLGARAAEKGVTLAVSCPDSLATMAVGDSGRVRQVLLNLAGNAIKFTEKGHVLIEVRSEPEAGLLRCRIKDTGVGIAPEAQARLFQKFVQADDSTTRRFGGTGLGLAISKSLVEMMRGEIGLESEPGKGSVFWFTIPLAGEALQNASCPAPTLAPGTRLLIIEPAEINRRVLAEQLGVWAVPHQIVSSTDEAVPVLMDESGNLAGWTALLLPEQIAGAGDAFTEVLVGFAQAGLKICTRNEPGHPLDPHIIEGVTIHYTLAAPLGRRDRLADMIESLKLEQPGASGTSFTRLRDGGETPEQLSHQHLHHVLVAEDNAVNMKLATKFLQLLGCNVDHAENGLQAVDLAANMQYDVIFMDCHMPECDGYEATRRIRIREQETGIQRTPIVALTANVMSEGREECAAAGMDDFVSKPVDLEDLREALDRWSKAAPSSQAAEQLAS